MRETTDSNRACCDQCTGSSARTTPRTRTSTLSEKLVQRPARAAAGTVRGSAGKPGRSCSTEDPYFPAETLRLSTDAARAPRAHIRLLFGEEPVPNKRSEKGAAAVRRAQYAVVWRVGEGPVVAGRLELEEDGVVLHGSAAPNGLRISFEELSSVKVGRSPGDRVNNGKSVVLERRSGDRVLVGALGDIGVVIELADLLTTLHAQRAAVSRIVVVVPIRRGAAQEARRLIDEGPPFDIEQLALERHHVFLTEREVVFYFEGERAAAVVEALARNPRVLGAAVRWRNVLAGRPRLAQEGFAWTRRS